METKAYIERQNWPFTEPTFSNKRRNYLAANSGVADMNMKHVNYVQNPEHENYVALTANKHVQRPEKWEAFPNTVKKTILPRDNNFQFTLPKEKGFPTTENTHNPKGENICTSHYLKTKKAFNTQRIYIMQWGKTCFSAETRYSIKLIKYAHPRFKHQRYTFLNK
mgnify:CR=1 FL=1